MREKVIIASDSTCDLSPELLERYQIHILPLYVNLGDEIYRDGVDIKPDDIYTHYEKTGKLPKTAAINMEDFRIFFEKTKPEDGALLFFTISSDMSSTCNNAMIAAEEFEDVYVIDTKNLSTGSGLIVIAAAEMAASGKTASEIAETCTKLTAHVDASFIVDNLEFLHKGGRCSAVETFGANLLQIKTCIQVGNGKMSVGKKYRGKFASVLKKDIELDRIFITHAGCDDAICRQCIEQVTELAPFKEVLFTRAGCTISSHCGRNTLGVLFMRKSPNQ